MNSGITSSTNDLFDATFEFRQYKISLKVAYILSYLLVFNIHDVLRQSLLWNEAHYTCLSTGFSTTGVGSRAGVTLFTFGLLKTAERETRERIQDIREDDLSPLSKMWQPIKTHQGETMQKIHSYFSRNADGSCCSLKVPNNFFQNVWLNCVLFTLFYSFQVYWNNHNEAMKRCLLFFPF